ncbi:MAG: phthiocerol/phthiodiolone dimycocerosyl transferase family protein [Segniliparus sp.]|uniref:phthiocerol/phthiodiolone dimycocerosyl transferase family protein n=1 Tax=Segniliparus sp. TaxID=2804064 RepID=UPI003F2D97CA
MDPPAIIGCGVSLNGPLDIAALTEAFGALRREFPDIAGRIEKADDGFDLVVDGPGKPAAELTRQFHQEIEKGVAADLDIGETLTALDVLTEGEDRHLAILRYSHTIADGTRATFLLFRLWSLYTQVVKDGSPDEIEARPVPASPEQALAERGIVKGPSSGEERLAGTRWHGAVPAVEDLPEGELRALRKRVVVEGDLLNLRAIAKKLGCSAYGLVTAALVIAERGAFADVPDDEPVPLGLVSTVDARFKLSPPIAPADVTNCVSTLYKRLDLTRDSSLVDVARQLSDQLRDDVASGLIQQTVLQPDPSPGQGPAVAVNYFGDLPSPELPDGLTADLIESVFEFDLSLLRAVVAMLPPGSPPPIPVGVSYYTGTFANKFGIEALNLPGLVPEQVVDGILERAIALLKSAAA